MPRQRRILLTLATSLIVSSLSGCGSPSVGLAVALPEPPRPLIPEALRQLPPTPESGFLNNLSVILGIAQPKPTS